MMHVLKTEKYWYLIYNGEIEQIDETVALLYKGNLSKRLAIGMLYTANPQKFQNQSEEASSYTVKIDD